MGFAPLAGSVQKTTRQMGNSAVFRRGKNDRPDLSSSPTPTKRKPAQQNSADRNEAERTGLGNWDQFHRVAEPCRTGKNHVEL